MKHTHQHHHHRPAFSDHDHNHPHQHDGDGDHHDPEDHQPTDSIAQAVIDVISADTDDDTRPEGTL